MVANGAQTHARNLRHSVCVHLKINAGALTVGNEAYVDTLGTLRHSHTRDLPTLPSALFHLLLKENAKISASQLVRC